MDRSTVAQAIASAPHFRHCTHHEAQQIALAMVELEVPDGTVLLREGGTQGGEMHAMYLVVSGTVEAVVGSVGATGGTVVHTMGPGEWFGMMSLIDDQPRAVTCRARGPVALGTLTRSAFRYLFETSVDAASRFQLAVAQQLARDLRAANAMLRERSGVAAVIATHETSDPS